MGRKDKTFTVCKQCNGWVYNWRLARQQGKCKCGCKLQPYTPTRAKSPKGKGSGSGAKSGQDRKPPPLPLWRAAEPSSLKVWSKMDDKTKNSFTKTF